MTRHQQQTSAAPVTRPCRPRPDRWRFTRTALRRASLGAAGPATAGVLIALAAAAHVPVTGWAHRVIQALSLIPAVLVHCHNRAERHHFSALTHAAVVLTSGLVAYLLIVVGLFAGAAATLAVVIAHQSGALAALGSLSGVLTLLVTLRTAGRQGPAPA